MTQELKNEREAFETWAIREFGFDRCNLVRQEDGYAVVGVDNAWDGWQARAAMVAAETAGYKVVPRSDIMNEELKDERAAFEASGLSPTHAHRKAFHIGYAATQDAAGALAKARSSLFAIAKTYDDEELRPRALEAYEATFDAARAAQPPAAEGAKVVPWESVIAAIYAVDTESARRGEMFPQTSDEQREDRRSVARVCEMIRWYAKNGGAGIEHFAGWPNLAAPASSASEGCPHGVDDGACKQCYDIVAESILSKIQPVALSASEPVPQAIVDQTAEMAFEKSIDSTMSDREDLLGTWLRAWEACKLLTGAPIASELNQCDGCRIGAPISERGNHAMPDGGSMGCTKDRYTCERTAEKGNESLAFAYGNTLVDRKLDGSYQTAEDAASQVQNLDVQNHHLRRAIQAMMKRLTSLLDEDQFAEMESIASGAGIEPPAGDADVHDQNSAATQAINDRILAIAEGAGGDGRPAPTNKADDEEIIALAAKHHIASESPVFNQQIVRFSEDLLARASVNKAVELTDAQLLEHLDVPGLNIEATLDGPDLRALLGAVRTLLSRAKGE